MNSSTADYDVIVGQDPSLYRADFNPAKAVAAFHTLPRFSHVDDFSLLFSDNEYDVADYSKGLLFVACLVISFFCVWGLLLLLFKCLGENRVGIFSGHPYSRKGCYSITGRAIFVFSSIIVFIFSILLVTKGVTPLEYSKNRIDASNQDVIKIRDELVGISNNLRSVAGEATPVRDQLVTFLQDDVCPLKPGSETETLVRDLANTTLVAMEELDNFIEDNLNDLDEALHEVDITTRGVDRAVHEVDFTGGLSVVMLIPYLIIPSFFVVTLIMGWCDLYSDAYYRFITWVVLPIFILMVIFAFVSAGFAALATEGNADFCAGGPDKTPEGTIDDILAQYKLSDNDFYYRAITFYANQCQTENPWYFLQVYDNHLASAKESLDSFAKVVLQVTTEQLSQECGVSYAPTLELMTQLQVYTSILLDSAGRSLDLMDCAKIVPLYTISVYDGICNASIQGATWIFASFFVIAFFSMIMVMFRAAYWPIYYYESYGDEKSMDLSLEEEGVVEGVSREESEAYDETINESKVYGNQSRSNRSSRNPYGAADTVLEDGEYEFPEEASGQYDPDGDTYTDGVSEK